MNYFVLVNKENKIKDSYYKDVKFIDTLNVVGEDTKVEEETYKNYLELKNFLEEKNIFIGIDTSYRNEEYGINF